MLHYCRAENKEKIRVVVYRRLEDEDFEGCQLFGFPVSVGKKLRVSESSTRIMYIQHIVIMYYINCYMVYVHENEIVSCKNYLVAYALHIAYVSHSIASVMANDVTPLKRLPPRGIFPAVWRAISTPTRLANCCFTKLSIKALLHEAPQALENEPTAATVSAVRTQSPPSGVCAVAAAVTPWAIDQL